MRALRALGAAAAVLGLALTLSSEQLNLSTSYPVPVGVYNRLITTGAGGVHTILARDGGNVGIGLGAGVAPAQKLHVGQNHALRVGQAFLSSGGDYAHLANNEWFNGSSWQNPTGQPGALVQLTGQYVNFYRHDGTGGHTYLAQVTPWGDVCNASGRCLNSGASLGQNGCFWANFATHSNYQCPWGYYVAGVCTTNDYAGCAPYPLGGGQNPWVSAGGVLCCAP